MSDEFDDGEQICGFPLVSIRKALGWVGVMDDRDDVKLVAEALSCGPRQAARVLEELERRGFVTQAAKPDQWVATVKGHRLAHDWNPPRRFRPAIERDDTNSPTNQGLENVPCLLLRSTSDGEDIFEEAHLDATFWVEYEGDHLVEVSVTEPDDHEDPGAGRIALSAYLSPASARAIATALQAAAGLADAEIARRARHAPKRHPVPRSTDRPAKEREVTSQQEATSVQLAPVQPRAAKGECAKARAPRGAKNTVAAALAELRETNDDV